MTAYVHVYVLLGECVCVCTIWDDATGQTEGKTKGCGFDFHRGSTQCGHTRSSILSKMYIQRVPYICQVPQTGKFGNCVSKIKKI